MTDIDPIQLAVKFSPPKLALVYNRGRENFIHEIPINSNELKLNSQEILKSLMQRHPGYLSNIQPAQIVRLLEMIKQNQSEDSGPNFLRAQNMRDLLSHDRLANFNRNIDEMDLYSPRSDEESYDKDYYEDKGHLDFAELDRDMADNSYGSYGEPSEDEIF
jgi:hypothetical protein